MNLTQPELDIIIAALRLWQQQEELSYELVMIAENGRDHGGFLTDDQIDTLIEEKLNA